MVMGANVGTSLTSTLVSLTQVTERAQFERAFAGKYFIDHLLHNLIYYEQTELKAPG